MSVRTARLGIAWIALTFLASTASGQPAPPGGGTPLPPVDRFRSAKEFILDGKFDLAAQQLKGFLESNPTDQDFFDLQNRYGTTVFEKLKLVRVWSEAAESQADAVKTVDEIISRAREANKKFFKNPARIAKYIRNLGATTEERLYAEQQLKASGDAVVKPMMDELRTTDDNTLRAGILSAIRELGGDTVPGILAAQQGMSDELKVAVLESLAMRPDIISMAGASETDPRPWLWYYSAPAAGHSPTLCRATTNLLTKLLGNISRRSPDVELVALARPFYERNARFATLDAMTGKVKVWKWNDAMKSVEAVEMTKAEAEEFYGLRDLRWALDHDPAYTPAQDMFLSLAVERAVERTKFGPLMKTEVAAYQLLADAPTPQLIRLLDRAMLTKRTAEVMGFAQGLADRADKAAVNPTEVMLPSGQAINKPGVLVKALDYPDPRVQLVAAIGLLRAPGDTQHGKQARVVEVLRRALAAEQPPAGTSDMGRALIADPSDMRSDKLSGFLRQLGYTTERFFTGRDLLRRMNQASDFDLVLIDRHIAGPQLVDILPQIKVDVNVGNRPILVIASGDAPKPVPLEHQMLILSVLIAGTEADEPVIATPFFIDPRKPPVADIREAKREIAQQRDAQLNVLYSARLSRLKRLIEAADFPPSASLDERLALRLPQLTYAVLAAEFPISNESAPITLGQYQSYTRRLSAQPNLTKATIKVPTEPLSRLIEQLLAALDDTRKAKIDRIRKRLDIPALDLPPDLYRDVFLEDRLAKLCATTSGVSVIAEPFGLVGLGDDVMFVSADPALQPRDPAQKRVAAQYAVEWLRRIALGDVTGYDVKPAGPALREALRDDELADPAIDALSRVPTSETQQDLLNVALAANRPAALRLKAADRTILHIQAYGKFVPATLVAAVKTASESEPVSELKGKLLVLHQLLGGQPGDLGKLLRTYSPPSAVAPPAAPAPPP